MLFCSKKSPLFLSYLCSLLFYSPFSLTSSAAADSSSEDPVALLSEYIRFETISTQPEHAPDLIACAHWLSRRFQKMGLQSEVYPTKGNPIVVAKTSHDPKKRTVLIYGHYDVQPTDPVQEWKHPPFVPFINKQEGKIYGRGSADDKGPTLAHVLGVEKTLKKEGSLPVNLIFLLEGEEEIGGPHLEPFLEQHKKELACDIIVISDTLMAPGGHPAITYATRGITSMEFIVRGPKHDLHSGTFGGAVANPLTVAAQLIASLHNAKGEVLIPKFYEGVKPVTPWERESLKQLDNLTGGDATVKKLAGVTDLFGEAGFTTSERLGARPSLDINGFGGGYSEKGTKTIIPKEAFVKLSFRLVPGQDPKFILDQTAHYLREQLPPGVSLEVMKGNSGDAYFFNPRSPYMQAAQEACQEAFGEKALFMPSGGTLPILANFKKILGADSLLIGLANADCGMHSTNENILIKNFLNGIQLNQVLLKKLAK